MSSEHPAAGSVWAIVVAGGGGTRFGGPKQFVEVAGRRVIDWAVDAAASVADGVVVVLPAADVDSFDLGRAGSGVVTASVVAGGSTRAASVRAGLVAVPADAGFVLVHDGARPAASAGLFRSVLAAVVATGHGVVPAVDVTDSLRWRAGGAVDRQLLVAVQTPQGFPTTLLQAAHASGAEATDDATLVEAIGGTISHVDGETTNIKLTHPDDLAAVARVLGGQA